ncbi:MAG: hypothetical protein ACI37N_11010 [Prevotella sp.]
MSKLTCIASAALTFGLSTFSPALAGNTRNGNIEKLDRGVVALPAQDKGVLLSWRLLADDDRSAKFMVVRDGTVIARNVSLTNFTDKEGRATSRYRIVTQQRGREEASEETTPWSDLFYRMPVNRPDGGTTPDGKPYHYTPNDCSVGDVDGDGKYELIVKWDPSNAHDNAHDGYTGNVILDCYRLDGTQLWRIDLGRNIRAGAHYTQFLVYDFDGDGKAEMICKTAPGAKDGKGQYVTDAATDEKIRRADNSADHRNAKGRILSGEELLTVFKGTTGEAIHTVWYNPNRGYGVGGSAEYAGWGDKATLGNRGERFLACVAFLDGMDKKPSAVMCRGYYTRSYLWAVDFNGKTLQTKWLHASISENEWKLTDGDGKTISQKAGLKATAYGQGAHSIAVADVDGDGCDEITYGSAAIDHDGSLLYSTGLGHGDAQHLTDLVPSRPGLEYYMVHEAHPYGADLRDAHTGEILWSETADVDTGRGMAADIDAAHEGSEMWHICRKAVLDCKGNLISEAMPPMNFRIYWDGDLQDELLGNLRKRPHFPPCLYKWNGTDVVPLPLGNGKMLHEMGNSASCNWTKATPNLQADIMGDWREELIFWDSSDASHLNIFTTNTPTEHRIPTLMHDHVYRMGVAWQNVAYNQPPHLGSTLSDYEEAAKKERGRQRNYSAEGREIVCRNGNNRYTRALYGTHAAFRLETSDRPVFATFKKDECRNIKLYAIVDNEKIALDSEKFDCEARYLGGRRSYTLHRGKLQIDITAMASFTADEDAIWRFNTSGQDVEIEAVLAEARSSKFQRNGDLGVDDLSKFEAKPDAQPISTAKWDGNGETFLLLKGNKELEAGKGEGHTGLKSRFADEERSRTQIMSMVEITTPDSLFNTLGSLLMAAADGMWDGETWLHGCIGWRMPLAGWRGCYVGDAVGWSDRSYRHYQAYARSQVKDVPPTLPHPTQDSTLNMARAEKRWGTQMYSNGYICRFPDRNDVMHHYDMNLNYIDGLLWHLSYDADRRKLEEFWPVLKSHLAWEKRNFDPDGDHLYDAYCCIWASDALYYNGGAVTHSSAYNYRGNLLAARIAEILGHDSKPYRDEAEAILKAMNERLWISDRGHWAEYQDLMGLKRLHKSAALWSIYTPIDCGACTAEQAYLATKYVDRDIPHIPIDIEGEGTIGHTISTTDWMPYAWSTNNVAHEEVANMALAYFQAGRSNEGFRLLKSDLTDEMLLGKSPGNFGQISHYDRERNEAYRDFGDNVGITSRAIINGLFGITPDALNSRCIIKPAFPDHWDKASIRTPYLSYTFRRKGNSDIYTIEHHFPQPLKIIVRTNAGNGAYMDTEGTSDSRQTIVIDRGKLPKPHAFAEIAAAKTNVTSEKYLQRMGLGDITPNSQQRHEHIDLSAYYNSSVTDIFRNKYVSPRPPYTTLQIPTQGIGEWCHPELTAEIDDTGLRNSLKPLAADSRLGTFDTQMGLSFTLPREGKNIVFTSLWDNYPSEITIPVGAKPYAAAYLMMAGTTNSMQSRIDNALVIASYSDNTCDTLHLENPINWPTINEEFVFDGKAFWSAPVKPLRFRLDNGTVSRHINLSATTPLANKEIALGKAPSPYAIHHGAGVILKMPLNPSKRLTSLRLVTLSNDIVAGLMGLTLER